MHTYTEGFQVHFAVIGVVKGGTTSLYHYLNQHPEIYLPPVKETNHFAQADIHKEQFLPSYALDVKIDMDAYIAKGMPEQIHIAHVDEPKHYEAIFARSNGAAVLGEISNSYMVCPSAAKAIHDFNPNMKIIAILRNPVKRAWSQYLMNLREAKTMRKGFIEELEADASQTQQGWGVNHQYLALGQYYTQLKAYTDLFGKSAVHVVLYEAYREQPQQVLAQLCRFLGVTDGFEFDFNEESNKASLPRFATLNKVLVQSGLVKRVKDMTPKSLRKHFAKALYSDKGLPTISDAEIAWLTSYYRSEVAQLEKLIGTDLKKYWPEFA